MNKKFSKPGYEEKKSSVVPAKKKNLKRAVVIVIAVMAVLCVLYLVLAAIDGALKESPKGTLESTQKNVNLEGKTYINYYEPDYNTDIFEDKEYLAKNRKIRYIIPNNSGKMSFILDEQPVHELTEGQRFFVKYFGAVTKGDYEAYGKMFAKEYLDDPDGFEKHPSDKKFPMQRIYDITVTELGRSDPTDSSYTYNGERAIFGVYEVSYKILKNDGEFRYDLPEGGEIPVIFELVTTGAGTENEKTLIKEYYRYADIADMQ